MTDHKLKVFLVEDNDDTRYLMAYLLRELGYEVQEAATVAQAVRDFGQSASDVLVSDLGLPDGSGYDLMRRLREQGEAPYAIAISGFGALSDVGTSRDAGFRHHLVKPIEFDALGRLLDEAKSEFENRRESPG